VTNLYNLIKTHQLHQLRGSTPVQEWPKNARQIQPSIKQKENSMYSYNKKIKNGRQYANKPHETINNWFQ
jgi:hypothetical protein